MSKREEIKKVIKYFQMIYKPFAFTLNQDKDKILWFIISFKLNNTTEVESLSNRDEVIAWLSQCSFVLEKCLVDTSYETFELIKDNIQIIEKLYFNSIDDLSIFLEKQDVNPDNHHASIWR